MPQREPSETRILSVASEHLRKFGLKRFTVVAVAEDAAAHPPAGRISVATRGANGAWRSGFGAPPGRART